VIDGGKDYTQYTWIVTRDTILGDSSWLSLEGFQSRLEGGDEG